MRNREICSIELKKAVRNKSFIFVITIGMILAVLSLIFWINQRNRDSIMYTTEYIYNPNTSWNTVYNKWIGGESGSLGSTVFFFVFPIIIALPFGWSYASEKKSGYDKAMIVHNGKGRYFFAKYLATFISGGLAMVIPMMFSMMITMCVFPIDIPFVTGDIYYAIFSDSLFAELFYTKPYLYVLIYLILDFIMCGLLACICITATLIIRQKYVVMIIPMLICLGIEYMSRYFFDINSSNNVEISPLYYLKPTQSRLPASGFVIGITCLILAVTTFVVPLIWERHHEIY